MTNYPIDDALANSEGTFEIDLLNKVTGTTYPQAAVYGTNTLGQILQEYAVDIGVNPNDSKILFENKRTGASTSNVNALVGEGNADVEGLDLHEGDVLAISDNAGVAGGQEAFEIDLLNKVTGTNYPQAAVYGTNTLGQILQEYAVDIGVNPNDSKILFENKRTGASTSNVNALVGEGNADVEGLDLHEGDVLAISDNAGVAADEEAFKIDLLNKVTGEIQYHARVNYAESLMQVLHDYAVTIGINPNESMICFENKRTGAFTFNKNALVGKGDVYIEGLDLQKGDMLAISYNTVVA